MLADIPGLVLIEKLLAPYWDSASATQQIGDSFRTGGGPDPLSNTFNFMASAGNGITDMGRQFGADVLQLSQHVAALLWASGGTFEDPQSTFDAAMDLTGNDLVTGLNFLPPLKTASTAGFALHLQGGSHILAHAKNIMEEMKYNAAVFRFNLLTHIRFHPALKNRLYIHQTVWSGQPARTPSAIGKIERVFNRYTGHYVQFRYFETRFGETVFGPVYDYRKLPPPPYPLH